LFKSNYLAQILPQIFPNFTLITNFSKKTFPGGGAKNLAGGKKKGWGGGGGNLPESSKQNIFKCIVYSPKKGLLKFS